MLSGAVKGALGFGLPLVSIALLPLFVPIETALPVNALVLILTNVQQVAQNGAHRAGLTVAWPVIAGVAVTILPAAFFAASIEPDTLTVVVGVLVLIFCALSVATPRLTISARLQLPAGLFFGALGGVLGALTSAPAAAFVTYIVTLKLPRAVYMTALGYVMLAFGCLAALAYSRVGMLTADHIAPAAAGIVAAIAGMAIGDRVAKRMPAETFRKIVLAVLATLALTMIVRGST